MCPFNSQYSSHSLTKECFDTFTYPEQLNIYKLKQNFFYLLKLMSSFQYISYKQVVACHSHNSSYSLLPHSYNICTWNICNKMIKMSKMNILTYMPSLSGQILQRLHWSHPLQEPRQSAQVWDEQELDADSWNCNISNILPF